MALRTSPAYPVATHKVLCSQAPLTSIPSPEASIIYLPSTRLHPGRLPKEFP